MNTQDLQPYAELLGGELSTPDLERVLELLMEENFAERGCFWIPNRDLVYCGDETLRLKFPFSRNVIKNVLNKGRGFVSFDAQADERLGPSQSIAANNVRSRLCAAARDSEGVVLAIAYFDNQASEGNFTASDLEFLGRVMQCFPGAAPASA